MLKPFMELYKEDVTGFVEKKPTFKFNDTTKKFVKDGELDYLGWVNCLLLLYKNGAKCVKYGNERNENGHPLFVQNEKAPTVTVWVDIDGDRRTLDYPIIDGAKDISMEKITQSDVHYATQRGFVKCVATNWGLGLSLWQKDPDEKIPAQPTKADYSGVFPWMCKKHIEEMLTALMKGKGGGQGMDYKDICAELDKNEREMKALMSKFDELDTFVKGVKSLYDKQQR